VSKIIDKMNYDSYQWNKLKCLTLNISGFVSLDVGAASQEFGVRGRAASDNDGGRFQISLFTVGRHFVAVENGRNF